MKTVVRKGGRYRMGSNTDLSKSVLTKVYKCGAVIRVGEDVEILIASVQNKSDVRLSIKAPLNMNISQALPQEKVEGIEE